MINKKINTVIDLGNSEIRLTVFDEKNKNIFSLIEEIEYLSKENNLSQSIKKIVRKLDLFLGDIYFKLSKKKQKEFMDHLFQDFSLYIETTLYVIFALK